MLHHLWHYRSLFNWQIKENSSVEEFIHSFVIISFAFQSKQSFNDLTRLDYMKLYLNPLGRRCLIELGIKQRGITFSGQIYLKASDSRERPSNINFCSRRADKSFHLQSFFFASRKSSVCSRHGFNWLIFHALLGGINLNVSHILLERNLSANLMKQFVWSKASNEEQNKILWSSLWGHFVDSFGR